MATIAPVTYSRAMKMSFVSPAIRTVAISRVATYVPVHGGYSDVVGVVDDVVDGVVVEDVVIVVLGDVAFVVSEVVNEDVDVDVDVVVSVDVAEANS